MNPRPRHVLLPLLLAAALVAGAVACLLVQRSASRSLVPIPDPPAADLTASLPAPPPEPAGEDAWAAVVPDESGGLALARRFRLAGTLLPSGGSDEPLAVLDDRTVARQLLVRLDEEVADGIRLVEVRPGEAVLEGPAGRATLRVDRMRAGTSPAPGDAADAGSGTARDAAPANRFGGREVFPGRWEFSRERLLDYYTELRREPERLVAVFDSLEPLWKDGDPTTRVIQGYQLNVQGEGDFFEAMGMRQGDIVRSVNSVDMTNRTRAEAFIEAFVLGELDTFVIDLERDGEPAQHVYVTQ